MTSVVLKVPLNPS